MYCIVEYYNVIVHYISKYYKCSDIRPGYLMDITLPTSLVSLSNVKLSLCK